MKNRISLLLLPVLAFGLSDLVAQDDMEAAAETPKTTTAAGVSTKKTTIVNADNPFAAQQKKIEDAQQALKGSKKNNKKSAEEKVLKEQDALKKKLEEQIAPLKKNADELQTKVNLYKQKNSSKAEDAQKDLDKVQAEIKRIQGLAAVDKWCTLSKDAATHDKKVENKKSGSKKAKKNT